jgi:hypothetical protein
MCDALTNRSPSQPDPVAVAQYSFGTLLGEARMPGGGRMCFYKFSFGIIMVPGALNLGCPGRIPASAASHGRLIANDN